MHNHDDFWDDYHEFESCFEEHYDEGYEEGWRDGHRSRSGSSVGRKPSNSSSEGCYIATAVYGSYDCPEVWVLRRFRDFGLRRSGAGRFLVRVYYRISPGLVKRFGCESRIREPVRSILDPFVVFLKNRGYADTAYND